MQPDDFACPKRGTIANYETGGKVQYLGTSENDPYNCQKIDLWGKRVGSLFNYYGVEKADYPNVRTALLNLFTRQSPSAVFVYVSLANRGQYKDTWRFLRRETVFVGSRKIEADVFERHNKGQLGNPHHSIWTLWLDPRSGIWIKTRVSVVSGNAAGVTPPGGDVTSISDP